MMILDDSVSKILDNKDDDTAIRPSDTGYEERKFKNDNFWIGMNTSGHDLTEGEKHNTSTEASHLYPSIPPVLVPPKSLPFTERFNALQKWEGRVICRTDDTFKAILTPIVGDRIEQEAEIYIEDLTPDEIPLIEPGAVFYWSIGYSEQPSGRRRESVLRFRRLPLWTDTDIEKKTTKDLRAYFDE